MVSTTFVPFITTGNYIVMKVVFILQSILKRNLFLTLIHALLIYIYNNMDTIIKMMYRTILEGTGNFVHNLRKGE